MPNWKVLAWICSLAFVSVGLRNFEVGGLRVDAPLYAAIARNIAHSGEWFFLYGNIPDFVPFAEHPHLGFWFQALLFKILPAEDWSARILGHLFYLAFLSLFFFYLKRKQSFTVAVVTIILLWSWDRFGSWFSSVYLDPGALFFGMGAVLVADLATQKDDLRLSFLSGSMLALCFLYKGTFVAGFLPTVGLIYLFKRQRFFYHAGILLLALATVLIPYFWALSQSKVPHFFEIYWQRQYTGRFQQRWELLKVFKWPFWHTVLVYTNYFALLIPFLGWKRPALVQFWIPLSLLITFVLFLAPIDRMGSQYFLLILPSLAWMIAIAAEKLFPIPTLKLMKVTSLLSIVGMFIVQYLPYRTHYLNEYNESFEPIKKLSQKHQAKNLYLYFEDRQPDFLVSGPFAWYTQMEIKYVRMEETPPPYSEGNLLFSDILKERKTALLKEKGWCLLVEEGHSHVWGKCEREVN